MSVERARAREIGIEVGILAPGRWNAITDVKGVLVGQETVWQGIDVRTGVTAILPHPGNIFQEKVPAGVHVWNAFGKAMGITQIEELGNIETPILLTNTLSVPRVAEALVEYILELPGNEDVLSVNPMVGETNDGYLNDIRGLHVTKEHALAAIKKAASGLIEEGSVGAGTGTQCFGFKGGIGTSSRVLPERFGGYTVGVSAQTNFGGILRVNGAPVGRELGVYSYASEGSCMIVVATDAPLGARNLKRLAKRAILGLGRTGSFGGGSSGEYVLAFSTAPSSRIMHRPGAITYQQELVHNDHMSPLFLAVVEAAEEAIYNSLFKATTVVGRDGHTSQAIPVDRVVEICGRYNVLDLGRKLPSEA